MRAPRPHNIATSLALVLACNVSFTNMQSVEIPGNADADAKLEIAKAVATQVWEADLLRAVKQRFPDLSESELRGIGVRWNTFIVKPIAGEDREPKTTISIQCVFQHKRGFEFGEPVVEFCKEAVEEALDAYMAQASAA